MLLSGTWTHFRRFASGAPKSGGDLESPGNGGAIERDLGSFECVTKPLTSNQDKCWALSWARLTLDLQRGEQEVECSLQEGSAGLGDGFGHLVDGSGGSGDALSSINALTTYCPPMTGAAGTSAGIWGRAGSWGGAGVPVGAPGFVCPLQGDTFRGTGGLWELSLEGLGAQLVSFILLRKEKGAGGRNT